MLIANARSITRTTVLAMCLSFIVTPKLEVKINKFCGIKIHTILTVDDDADY